MKTPDRFSGKEKRLALAVLAVALGAAFYAWVAEPMFAGASSGKSAFQSKKAVFNKSLKSLAEYDALKAEYDRMVSGVPVLAGNNEYQDGGHGNETRHRQKHALGSNPLRQQAGYETTANSADDSAASYESKQPLRLAGSQNIAGQRPHLSDRHDAENSDPNVEHRQQPFARPHAREPPEQNDISGKEKQAGRNQIHERHQTPGAEVQNKNHAHEGGNDEVDVRQAGGFKAV